MEMRHTLYIRTPSQWKALSHPLRLAIIRLTRAKAMTNEELAREIGVASGKLYFHTKMLLSSGLILSVGTRQKGAITEKLYRATALHFQTEPERDHGDDFFAQLDSQIELYKTIHQEFPELAASPENLDDYSLLMLTPDQAQRLKSDIQELIGRAVAESHPQPGAIPMAPSVIYHRLPIEANPSRE